MGERQEARDAKDRLIKRIRENSRLTREQAEKRAVEAIKTVDRKKREKGTW